MRSILLILIVMSLFACDPVRHERYSIIIRPPLAQSSSFKQQTISTSTVAALVSDTAEECQYSNKNITTEYPSKGTVEFGFFEYGVFFLSQKAKNTRNTIILKLKEKFGDQVEIVKID